MSLTRGIRRPAWICSTAKQQVVLLRDSSASMATDQKALKAMNACLDLISEISGTSQKDGFRVSVVDFSEQANMPHRFQKATDLERSLAPIKPQDRTNITAALETAHQTLLEPIPEEFEKIRFLRPVVLLFSDGGHNEGPDPDLAAHNLREIADVVSVAFGDDADELMLRDIASTSQHFYRCKSGQELRGFLASVGETLVKTLAANSNATVALAALDEVRRVE